ncbi:MAG TPA: hypothetical protein VIW25_10300, partial [Nitrososphaeraceae archaeon]
KGPFLPLYCLFFVLSLSYWFVIGLLSHSSDVFVYFRDAIERTLLDIFQGQTGRSQVADYVIKALTIPILGTLLIPLRRRLERKFTR